MDHVPFSSQVIVPPQKTGQFFLYWGPVLFLSALIFWLSSRSTVPELPGITDKFLHFAEYFVYALLLGRAITGELLGALNIRRALIIGLIASLYAVSDEMHQSFVPGRYASIYDWFADVAGILGMITLRLSRVKWRGGTVNYHYEKI